MRDFVVVSSDSLDRSLSVVKTVAVIVWYLHIATCLWHVVGHELRDGWVSTNNLLDDTVANKYLVSLHFMVMRFGGDSATLLFGTPKLELVYDCFTVLFGVLINAYLIAVVYQAVCAWATSNANTIHRLTKSYMRRHRISKATQVRARRYLKTKQAKGPGELIDDETHLINNLPLSLQEDFLAEARIPFMCLSHPFSDTLGLSPRCMRHICYAAVNDAVCVEGEKVFALGDACAHIYFVRSGAWSYTWLLPEPESESHEANESWQTRTNLDASAGSYNSAGSGTCGTPTRNSMKSKASFKSKTSFASPSHLSRAGTCVSNLSWNQSINKADANQETSTAKLCKGQVISEAALWTHWERRGELVADCDSLLLKMAAVDFSNIVVQHHVACAHAVKYARRFVYWLNQSKTSFTDIMDTSFTLAELDEDLGTFMDHFAFISHYKNEAGTEAALLRDLMLRVLEDDPNCEAGCLKSPIFVDSEDLMDIGNLFEHVKKSKNFVLLLTPDVLTRPWCLLEILIAYRDGVQIVPVEIQRPGLQFEYPDEEFYNRFRAGAVLGTAGMNFLDVNGGPIEDVEEAVRNVFRKIAVPFSPHKSGNVRQAEITDILKRCVFD